mgnify:CR=1 FL=1
MNLNWKENKGANSQAAGEHVSHYAECGETAEDHIKTAIALCVEKAVSLLEVNAKDESMYLMFEWNTTDSELTIVVTDQTKQRDSDNIVQCHFTALNKTMSLENFPSEEEWKLAVNEYAEDVNFWIRDYLTTCTSFLNYSLIAAFHCGNRNASKLL